MAIEERRVCDVFGTQRDVAQVRVTVETRGFADDEWAQYDSFEADMGIRARGRLTRWIARAFSKPSRKKSTEPEPVAAGEAAE